MEEKHEIEEEFMNYRRSVENTSLGNAAKEIKILKSLAKSLEQDMAEQRAKHMHSANRRKQDYNKLLNEVIIYVKIYVKLLFSYSNLL